MKALILIAVCLLLYPADSCPAPLDQAQPAALTKPSLRWIAYDGDPAKTDPKVMSFQIERSDLRQPTQFLQLGRLCRAPN